MGMLVVNETEMEIFAITNEKILLQSCLKNATLGQISLQDCI